MDGEQGAESIHKILRLLQILLHPYAKALKPVILERKWHPKGDQIQRYHKNIDLNFYYVNLIFELYSVSIVSMHQIFSTHKIQRPQDRILKHQFCLMLSKKQTFVTKVKKKCKDT